MANKHVKRSSTSYIIREIHDKLKPYDTTAYLSEWLKSKILTISNVGKNTQQQQLSFVSGGKAKVTNTEIWFGSLNIQFNSPVPRYLPNSLESLCPHKHLYENVYRSFIHNSQNMLTI